MAWRDPQEAEKLALLNSLDGMAGIRHALKSIAHDRNEWAGIPLPLDDQQLIIEPSYPKAAELSAIGAKPAAEPEGEQPTIRNTFWSSYKMGDVVVFEQGGKIDWGVHRFNRLGHAINTLGCAIAWGIEQERNAIDLLGTLLRPHNFKQYLLTGMFLETSAASGVTYVFRRLRPTVALRLGEPSRVLCTLCLHPIGYYAGSWAGAMTPTDDVVAHLMLMRGDEPMFWRRSNQHAPWRPEAGL